MVYNYKEIIEIYENDYNLKKALRKKEIFKLDKGVYSNKKIVSPLVIYSKKYPNSVITYAHYLFDERVETEGLYACYNLNCGILLETKDGYYIVGEMSETTSYPKGLQISGGNLDQNDIKQDGQVDIVNNVARELNIDLLDKTLVQEYKMQYMEMPQERRHSYTLMMKGILCITAKQMEERYGEYKRTLEQSGEDVEFEKLHFIKKENALEILRSLDNPKRPYLENLIDLDISQDCQLER